MTIEGLTRDEETHTYRYRGEVLPSVTQILALVKGDMFDRVPPDVLERKRAIGTATHFACELDVAGELDEASVHEEVAPYLAGFRRWRAESGFEVVETEAYVMHPRLRYAGQLDLICRRQGDRHRWLVDIKTAHTATPLWRLQTAGYVLCREDATALKRAALQLLPDGTYRWIPHDGPECAHDTTTWTGLVMLHHWMKANLK